MGVVCPNENHKSHLHHCLSPVVMQVQSNFLNIDPKGPSQVSALQMCQAYYWGTECVELGIFGSKRIFYNRQGHPMDLFHKISVLLAVFCWLGDVEVMICPWKESVVGNLMSGIAAMCCQKPLPHSPPPLTPHWTPNFLLRPTRHPPSPLPEGLNSVAWPHPNWPLMSGHMSAGKLPSKSGCRLKVHLAGWELFSFH